MAGIYIGNDSIVRLTGLYAVVDSAYVNDADVAMTITDCHGAEVAGATWPVAMDYVSGSDGDYRAVLGSGLALEAGETYNVRVVADAGGAGRIGVWNLKFRARERGDE